MASATGTYTGDGSTNRTIALAFTPKLVFLNNDTEFCAYFSNVNTGTYGHHFISGTVTVQTAANATRPALTTNGFIVSGNTAQNTNVSAKVYYYFASG